jgi:beta-lactamase class A
LVFGIASLLVVIGLKFAATKTASVDLDASVTPTPIPVASPAFDCEANSPASPEFVSTWSAEYGAVDFNATVSDLVHGCVYSIGDQTKTFKVASTGKVMVAIGILESVAAGSISYESVEADMNLMITQSDNTAADRLFVQMGGNKAMSDLISRYGLVATNTGQFWGTITTNSADQTHLLAQTLGTQPSPLPEKQRVILRDLMSQVNPEQAWGAGAGVPANWVVAVKNGWYLSVPGDTPPIGLWRINTVGYVWDETGKARWSLAGYSNTWESEERGESAWSDLSEHVAKVLGTN